MGQGEDATEHLFSLKRLFSAMLSGQVLPGAASGYYACLCRTRDQFLRKTEDTILFLPKALVTVLKVPLIMINHGLKNTI